MKSKPSNDRPTAVFKFGNRPLIALTLVIGPLLELPIMALVAKMLLRSRSDHSKRRSLT